MWHPCNFRFPLTLSEREIQLFGHLNETHSFVCVCEYIGIVLCGCVCVRTLKRKAKAFKCHFEHCFQSIGKWSHMSSHTHIHTKYNLHIYSPNKYICLPEMVHLWLLLLLNPNMLCYLICSNLKSHVCDSLLGECSCCCWCMWLWHDCCHVWHLLSFTHSLSRSLIHSLLNN